MDHLWSPWRYRYVSKALPEAEPPSCVFCRIGASADDRANLVIHRGERGFVVLNRYPYTSGHLMVVPYPHAATLAGVDEATSAEMMRLTRQAEGILREVYSPRGVNIGMNIGECAGAGVAEHIHMHVLPRWPGDVNFMTAVGETRVLPEDLDVTFERLAGRFGPVE